MMYNSWLKQDRNLGELLNFMSEKKKINMTEVIRLMKAGRVRKKAHFIDH